MARIQVVGWLEIEDDEIDPGHSVGVTNAAYERYFMDGEGPKVRLCDLEDLELGPIEDTGDNEVHVPGDRK